MRGVEAGFQRGLGLVGVALLAACAHPGAGPKADMTDRTASSVARLQIIAFNDFHGHIGPDDQSVLPPGAPAGAQRVKAGGAAQFAAAIARLRAENPASAVVSAGDMISASPLISGYFLDEPTVRVMNSIRVDFNALGNHEFDRGKDELKRMQSGGCARFTTLEPCQVMPNFPGANFPFLAANTITTEGKPLFAPYGIKALTVGGRTVKIGFVGLTLKGAADIVSPKGVAGLHFEDEAKTANALLPELRKQGADIFAVLIHQGGSMKAEGDPGDCATMIGDLPAILDKLDPAFDLVISGHTHQAYACTYRGHGADHPVLVSSAGQYGTLLTRISLDYDVKARKLVSKTAENLVVTQDGDIAAQQPEIAALVARYQAAGASVINRVVGRLAGPLTNAKDASGQSLAGNYIADAQFAAMAAPDKGGAQFALMNAGGVRAAITPATDGSVRFGDLYTAQPFGNMVMVKELKGADVKAAIEQQFTRSNPPMLTMVSRGFSYAYDKSKPEGQRVFDLRLNGQPFDESATYRVAMNNFMAQGGDGNAAFANAPLIAEGPVDVDALEAYVTSHSGEPLPALDRIRNVTPQ